MLIESRPGMAVVGEAGTQTNAIAIASREKPDIILLDLDLGLGCSGIDLMPQLLSAASDARILLLTGVRDSEAHQRAVSLGAVGLVLKEKAAEELFRAIEKVYAGELWLDRLLTAHVFKRMTRNGWNGEVEPETDKISLLSEREREVVTLVSEGLKNREIAERLFISETTVRHHLTSIFSKLDVSNRLELVIFLHEKKLARIARQQTTGFSAQEARGNGTNKPLPPQ
jgi:two-component system nitrate/nitrite response regulator NarL